MSAHEHEHEHGITAEIDAASAHINFEGHVHEQAAAVTMTIVPFPSTACEFSALSAAMQDIGQGIETAGGIVGHIKLSARQEDTAVHASIVQAGQTPISDGDVTALFDSTATIQMAVIALLIDLEELMDICKKACELL